MILDMKKPKVVTINPGKWGRSSLYNKVKDEYCALGFLAHSAGVPVETILDEKVYDWLRKEGISPVRIYAVNDDPKLSDSERRAKLKALFKEAGIRLLFSDERRKARYVIAIPADSNVLRFKYVTANIHTLTNSYGSDIPQEFTKAQAEAIVEHRKTCSWLVDNGTVGTIQPAPKR